MNRVRGGQSLHFEYDPNKCPKTQGIYGKCGTSRCVDCCKQIPDTDIIECAKCGYQTTVPCFFDEEYS